MIEDIVSEIEDMYEDNNEVVRRLENDNGKRYTTEEIIEMRNKRKFKRGEPS